MQMQTVFSLNISLPEISAHAWSMTACWWPRCQMMYDMSIPINNLAQKLFSLSFTLSHFATCRWRAWLAILNKPVHQRLTVHSQCHFHIASCSVAHQSSRVIFRFFVVSKLCHFVLCVREETHCFRHWKCVCNARYVSRCFALDQHTRSSVDTHSIWSVFLVWCASKCTDVISAIAKRSPHRLKSKFSHFPFQCSRWLPCSMSGLP